MKLSFQLELIKKNINLFSFSSLSFILSIVIGVGSVTGINSYKNTLKSSILKESRNLMGADLLFESSRKLDENQLKFISDNLPKDSNITFTVQFISMLESKKSNDSAITMVKANSILFPFYGEVGTIPQNIYKNIGNNQILLDESITKNLDIKIGDVVKLGNIQFELIGFISREPLSGLGGFSGMAPTSIININSLSSTGLEQRGSRIRYNYFVTIPEKLDSFEIKKNLFSKFIKEDITIIHHTEVGSGTQKFIFNTLDYMTLLGLSAFFLGAISILITVRTRLQSKITEIAILKCLGANSFFSIKIFLSEIMLLSFIGSVLGISAGYLIQFIIPDLTSSEYLSKINPSLDFISLIWGFLIGLVVPFTLTIDSIYAIVKQSPLGAIRSETESKVKLKLNSKKVLSFQVFTIYILFFIISYIETYQILKAIILSLILVFLPLTLYLLYFSFRSLGKFISSFGFVSGSVRLILGKISKTGSGLSLPIIGIGSSLTILLLSIVVRAGIINLGGWDVAENRPNMFIMDIKPDQLETITETYNKYDIKEKYISSMISARLKKINNNELKKDDIDLDAMNRDWKSTAKTREYFLSIRNELYSTEEISSGIFWNEMAINEISVEKDFAKALGVRVGDTLEFDIQGIGVSGKITNIREVNWSDMKPNFVVIFSNGELNNAPSHYISSFYISDSKKRYEIQKELVRKYPNLTIFDIEKTISSLNSIFEKVNSIINLMTYFIFSSSILLLFSSLYLQEKERKQETALYKIVGATPTFLRKIYSIEAIAVSSYSFICSLILALIANYFISKDILGINYKIPILSFLYVFISSTFVILAVYLLSIQNIINIPPKKYLYSE